jgi:hypothetical protein
MATTPKAWDNTDNKKITSQSTIEARTAEGLRQHQGHRCQGSTPCARSTATHRCSRRPSSLTMHYDVQQASPLNAVFAPSRRISPICAK